MYIIYYVPWDSPLVWHLPTSWGPTWQPVAAPPACFSRDRMPDSIWRPPTYRSDVLTTSLMFEIFLWYFSLALWALSLSLSLSRCERTLTIPPCSFPVTLKIIPGSAATHHHKVIALVPLPCQQTRLRNSHQWVGINDVTSYLIGSYHLIKSCDVASLRR